MPPFLALSLLSELLKLLSFILLAFLFLSLSLSPLLPPILPIPPFPSCPLALLPSCPLALLPSYHILSYPSSSHLHHRPFLLPSFTIFIVVRIFLASPEYITRYVPPTPPEFFYFGFPSSIVEHPFLCVSLSRPATTFGKITTDPHR